MASPVAGKSSKKVNIKLQDDALFKAIGSQLGAAGETFDYTQWQRANLKDAQAERRGTSFAAVPKKSKKAKSAVSRSKERAKDTKAKKSEKHIWLESKVETAKQTIQQYRILYKQLLQQNLEFKQAIEGDEAKSHADVQKLLRKYERFRGGIAALNGKFKETCAEEKEDLQLTKVKLEIALQAVHEEVHEIDRRLKKTQKELNVLVNYKDKEYPLKSLKISDLQKELHNLHIQNQEESKELRHIVDTEMDKYRKERTHQHKDIVEEVSQEHLQKLHPSWKELATQNIVMSKEVEVHSKEIEGLEQQINELDANVKRLLNDPKTNLRRQLYPQLFTDRPKCTPDMEVFLDIPTQEFLPI